MSGQASVPLTSVRKSSIISFICLLNVFFKRYKFKTNRHSLQQMLLYETESEKVRKTVLDNTEHTIQMTHY